MPALSATDAISPAIQRTREFLFRPFRLGTYLKLCLIACVTEASGGGNFNFSNPGHHTTHAKFDFFPSLVFTPGLIGAIVAGSLALLVLGYVLFYLITRLRFAYFHCLIHNVKEIRPGWRLYRTPAIRFFWLNVKIGICCLVFFGLIAFPFVWGFWKLFRNVHAGAHFDIGLFLFLFLPLIPIVLLLIVISIALRVILRDFMLPYFALENASAGAAWTGAWGHIKAEKAQFFVYALLRVFLPAAATFVIALVLIFPAIFLAVMILLTGAATHIAFSHATIIAFVTIAVVIAMLVFVVLNGPVLTATRQYALFFYGGRYQLLGDILMPPGAGLMDQALPEPLL